MTTPLPTLHKATQPGDFLAAVPPMLGYQPTDSVVVIPFDGPRTIGAMRFDLPSVENAVHLATVAAGLVCRVENATGLAVIASGGVATLEDLQRLKEYESVGIEGVIIGMALYRGAIQLPQALRVLQGH